jgi:phosphopantothenoylcysteine decarboxylase/phosphopantothenate--cysteine ligase
LKKTGSGDTPALALIENPDILKLVTSKKSSRPTLAIGFAAETDNVVAHAQAKLAAKGCDWIVANDVSSGSGVMGGDNNQVHLVTAAGVESWPAMTKDAVARELMRRAAAHYRAGQSGSKAAE